MQVSRDLRETKAQKEITQCIDKLKQLATEFVKNQITTEYDVSISTYMEDYIIIDSIKQRYILLSCLLSDADNVEYYPKCFIDMWTGTIRKAICEMPKNKPFPSRKTYGNIFDDDLRKAIKLF